MFLTQNYSFAPVYIEAANWGVSLKASFCSLEEKGFCYYDDQTGVKGYARIYLSGAVQEYFNQETIPSLVELGNAGQWEFFHASVKGLMTNVKRQHIKKFATYHEINFKASKRDRLIKEIEEYKNEAKGEFHTKKGEYEESLKKALERIEVAEKGEGSRLRNVGALGYGHDRALRTPQQAREYRQEQFDAKLNEIKKDLEYKLEKAENRIKEIKKIFTL